MPIMECVACSKTMSTQSKRCPHCGYAPPHSSMLGFKLLLVLVLAAAAGTYTALRRSPQGRAALQSVAEFARSEAGVSPAKIEAETETKPVVDLRAIAGKSSKEVAALLGKPFKHETVNIHGTEYPANFYADGRIQVVFVKGRADWITVYHLGSVPFGAQALPAFRLAAAQPAVRSTDVLKWQDLGGIREIDLFAANGASDYATVFVTTEP